MSMLGHETILPLCLVGMSFPHPVLMLTHAAEPWQPWSRHHAAGEAGIGGPRGVRHLTTVK